MITPLRTQFNRTLTMLVLVGSLCLSGCVSTVVGVTAAAAKGTVKVGTGVVKAGGKAAGAVVGGDDDEEKD